MHRKTLVAALASLALCAGTASAAPSPVFTYGGYLLDSAGNPIAAPTDLTFRFYTAAVGGSQVGTAETLTANPGTDGYFTTIVGVGVVGFPARFDNSPLFMSIQAVGDGAEMSPRIPITSVPSALSAVSAQAVPFAGISGWPSQTCSGYLTGIDTSGLAICNATPPGTLSAVTGSGPISATVAGSSAAVSLAPCGANQIYKMNVGGTAWTCGADVDTNSGGTVTGVTGSGPITVSTSTTTPAVSLTSCAANQVWKMNAGGTAWSCQADANSGGTVTSVTAGTVAGGGAGGIVVGGTAATPTVALTDSGCQPGYVMKYWSSATGWVCAAENGIHVPVPLSTMKSSSASVIFTTLTMGSFVKMDSFQAPAGIGYSIDSVRVIPSAVTPLLRVIVHNPNGAAATYGFSASFSGVAAGVALPTSRTSTSVVSQTIAANQTATFQFTLGLGVSGGGTATFGDLLWFSFNSGTGNTAHNVIGAELIF